MVGSAENKASSAPIELGLGLSLAIKKHALSKKIEQTPDLWRGAKVY